MKRIVLLLLLSLLFVTQAQLKEQRLDLFENIPVTSNDVVFVGNSITNGGQWVDIFPNISVKNRGISGNTTTMVLDRLSMITKGEPRKIFLMIGVNDLGSSTDVIVENIGTIIERIKAESPSTTIYVQSVLPVNSSFTNFGHNQRGATILELNSKLVNLCMQKEVTYIDLHSEMKISATNNNLNPVYTNDGLHLLGEGYAKWASLIAPYVESEPTGINSGVGYTNSAGVSTYSQQLVSQYNALNGSSSDVVIYGDYTINSADWAELFGDKRVKSRGVDTDINHLVNLVPNVVKNKPGKVFLYAGMKGLNTATLENTKSKISELAAAILTESPNTEVYIQSLLPRQNEVGTNLVKQVNIYMEELCETNPNYHYVDLFTLFTDINSDNLNSYYHLSNGDINAKGFIAWANHLAPLIDKEIKAIQFVED